MEQIVLDIPRLWYLILLLIIIIQKNLISNIPVIRAMQQWI